MVGDFRNLMDKEREAERTKNELITNVAHDLLTPLTSIIGYLELLSGKVEIPAEMQIKYMKILLLRIVGVYVLCRTLYNRRPAESAGFTFFHKTGESSKPTIRSKIRRACCAFTKSILISLGVSIACNIAFLVIS